jgi:hypothetical protein
MSMKNPVTPSGIEPATFRFVVQRLNQNVTAYPSLIYNPLFLTLQVNVVQGFPITILYSFLQSHIHVAVLKVCDQSMTGSLSVVHNSVSFKERLPGEEVEHVGSWWVCVELTVARRMPG